MALPSPLVRPWRLIRRHLPARNFLTLHYTYFVTTCLVSAVIFWGASTPTHSVEFVDALFMVVSAMTLSGLGTINLSSINTFQQVLLLVLIVMGSAVFVGGVVVFLRKRAFEARFRIVVEGGRGTTSLHRDSALELREVRRGSAGSGSGSRGVETPAESPGLDHAVKSGADGVLSKTTAKDESRVESAVVGDDDDDDDEGDETVSPTHLTFSQDTRFTEGSDRRRSRLSSGMNIVPVDLTTSDDLRPTISIARSACSTEGDRLDPNRYLDTSGGWVSRNSQFHGLTERERERLGGYEYRAVSLLAWLVPAYSITFQLLGCLGCGAWIAYNRPDTATANGINPWWLGAFNAVSAFSKSTLKSPTYSFR